MPRILVRDDTPLLALYESVEATVLDIEGIDIEGCVRGIWDESGNRLEPRFTTPNRRGRGWFGCEWVVSGRYTLVSTREDDSATLLEALDDTLLDLAEYPPPRSDLGYLAALREIRASLARRLGLSQTSC